MKSYLRYFSCIITVMVFMAVSPVKSDYGVGDKVSDFTLKNVDGKMVSLSDYQTAKGVILIFDSNTCPYSKAYNERIMALNKKYASQGFPVVTINANNAKISRGDSFEEMVAQAKRKKYDFPYLTDETQQVARKFGATNTPHVFVLTREGKSFEVAYIGAIDNNSRNGAMADKKYVEDAVNSLLAGQPVTTTRTKAVGCGIQWKNR